MAPTRMHTILLLTPTDFQATAEEKRLLQASGDRDFDFHPPVNLHDGSYMMYGVLFVWFKAGSPNV